ncbi:MAG: hypothetical protein HN726_02750 [Candidatus Magasanikbacteria bacterium]|jgi:uncharacterized repeat protein (TIGR01451 family)|nr:hypothetical protein [Candidatus Magasanikbacteria bacterium]MBT4221213.1 hypothetical protein [Candidatus Magasanikbacteria bacterium]MBT4350642.1 hypothetical protein [Candidatus Magasanikbacteria bacterium]MBT4541358.1 hypothetical protein [Candidatus Magasanikbacteria bacterium]MBT6253092.1 hypothetical protein [Candidatus Magasanikbacteria bacterium]
MHFFKTYFTKHHLRRNPHKWFTALVLSPIHAAELRYKRKYHLKFRHAKKLFFFDLLLVFSTVILIFFTIFWFTYNPTVTDLVSVSIDVVNEDAKSGEDVSYTITYTNNSSVILTDPRIELTLPSGFIMSSSSFDTAFALPNVAPGESGDVSVFGQLFGVPGFEYAFTASFIYTQDSRAIEEEKKVSAFLLIRESVLEGSLLSEEVIASGVPFPVTLSVINTHTSPLFNVSIPFPSSFLPSSDQTVSVGHVSSSLWSIPVLSPNEEATLQGDFAFQGNRAQDVLSFSPEIKIDDQIFSQLTLTKTLRIVQPSLSVSSKLDQEKQYAQPGDTVKYGFTFFNDGDVDLENLSFRVPYTPWLDQQRVRVLYPLVEQTIDHFVFTSKVFPSFRTVEPGTSILGTLDLPVMSSKNGDKNITMSFDTIVKADVSRVPAATYTTSFSSPQVPLGTSMSLFTSARYYTDDGDQIGRGPLPPQVQEQTKYWVILHGKNGTSDARDVFFRANLPSYITWTDRSSVSIGNAVTYHPSTHSVSWYMPRISAHETFSINMELGFTPQIVQKGTHVPLLDAVFIEGHDTYIDLPFTNTFSSVDTRLIGDEFAHKRGDLAIQ